MKKYVLLFIAIISLHLSAQVRVSTQVPEVVAAGDKFRLEFVVNSADIDDIRIPVLTGFEVLYGPSTSTMQSIQIINGKKTNNSSTTLTYTVVANKSGTYTIPGATVKVGGKSYKANSVRLRVVPSNSNSRSGGRSSSSSQGVSMSSSANGRISAKDLFITLTANKTKVYEQEAVLLTYKVYSRVNLTQLSGKMPDLKGFLVQEINLPQEKSFTVENYKGQNYKSCVWSQYVLFPQQAGKLTIPSIRFDGIVVVPDAQIDPFEAFFNGGVGGIEKKKSLMSPDLTIDVKELPKAGRSANFSGGVGKLSITAQNIGGAPKTGEAMTFRVVLSGRGNMKLLKTPDVKFPSDFERYAPKTSENTKLTVSGMEGSMTFDFLVVPRKEGRAEIPPIEYTYFDTDTHSYITLRTSSVGFSVGKGKGGAAALGKDDIDFLNQDIRYIKLGDENLKVPGRHFAGSVSYWMTCGGIILAFIIVTIALRERIKRNSDAASVLRRGAGKKANKRLAKAEKLMRSNKNSLFYEEMMRAINEYVSHRFQIPVAELTKDTMLSTLKGRGIEEDVATEVVNILSECEFARYAPSANGGKMDTVLSRANVVINSLEQAVKKNKL